GRAAPLPTRRQQERRDDLQKNDQREDRATQYADLSEKTRSLDRGIALPVLDGGNLRPDSASPDRGRYRNGERDHRDDARGDGRLVPAGFMDREVTHRKADEPGGRSAEHGEPQSRAAAAREGGGFRGLAGRR